MLKRNLYELDLVFLLDSYPKSGGTEIVYHKGWALKGKKNFIRHSEKQLDFVRECFNSGIESGANMKPQAVVKAMLTKRDGSGKLYFC